jgi:V-type H+-transporting ATPase subunit C
VPASAKRLGHDIEYVLYSVVVFKKGEEDFKAACRNERYTVRSFESDPNEEKNQKEAMAKTLKKQRQLFGHLLIWSKTYFSDLFAAWIHIKVMRCFVEAVLRYGLPAGDKGGNVDHQYFLLAPKPGDKARKALNSLYSHLGDAPLPGDAGEDASNLETQFGEFFSYVSMEFNLPSMEVV